MDNDVRQELNSLKTKWRNLCRYVRCCLGISSEGDETLFLNQKGQWTEVGGSGGNSWNLQGNAGTDPDTNFLGTTDNVKLVIGANGVKGIEITGSTFPSPNMEVKIKGFVYSDVLTAPAIAVQTPIKDKTITLNAPSATTADYSIILPVNNSEGYLMNDGLGNTSWKTLQEMLSTLPSYLDDANAESNGLPIGASYFATLTSCYTRRMV